MNRGRSISLSFPPFTPWVKKIVLTCAGVYVVQIVLQLFAPTAYDYLLVYFGLSGAGVMHGFIWQLVTYSFLHDDKHVWHLLLNMLTLWMFGSQEEQDWGSRRFVEYYFFCVIGAALVTVGVSYTGFGMHPFTRTIGASGGIYGLLIAFGMLYGNRELFLFPIPFLIKAKYLVAILIFIVLISTIQPAGGVANFAHLGGLFFGFLYLKLLPRRGLGFATSEKYFSLRNSYYRWKRKRAARKFEVYMKQHDRKVTFDEHGNYLPPEDDDKKNGGSKSGWVN